MGGSVGPSSLEVPAQCSAGQGGPKAAEASASKRRGPGGHKAAEAPTQVRRGPQWSQSSGGTGPNAAGDQVVPKRQTPPPQSGGAAEVPNRWRSLCNVAGTEVVTKRRGTRNALVVPKWRRHPDHRSCCSRWAPSSGGPSPYAVGAHVVPKRPMPPPQSAGQLTGPKAAEALLRSSGGRTCYKAC